MSSSLFGSQFTLFRHSLDLQQQRLGTIANNVANAETPGYHAKRLQFDQQLRQAHDGGDENLTMVSTNPRHFDTGGSVSDVQPQVREVVQGGRVDGNTVNTQQELERLGETRLLNRVVSELAARRASGIEYAIRKGGE
ncbi:MAG: flagellar basal body rod protein FlgB [Thiohalorhabdus sp.]|uniref:flagellar basal body rod protein FlgB n=1 Tax=Thiohalorhabdus sp. TaxID=3094134 RepID=UPI002FC2E655